MPLFALLLCLSGFLKVGNQTDEQVAFFELVTTAQGRFIDDSADFTSQHSARFGFYQSASRYIFS